MHESSRVSLRYELKRRRADVLESIADNFVAHYLARRARRHLSARRPQQVIFSFDHIGHRINLDGIYERDALELIGQWLLDNKLIRGCAVDIGANIGNHSLFFAQYFEQVFAFEPNPRTFSLLALNVRLCENVAAFAIGLSDQATRVPLWEDQSNLGHSALTQDVTSSQSLQTATTVDLRPLDTIGQIQRATIGLIKIDVEGHELQALMGARATIARNQPIILFEQLAGEFRSGTTPVIELLKSLDYHRFAVIRSRSSLSAAWPRFLRSPLNMILKLVAGTTWVLTEIRVFQPKTYSLIVAIPGK